MKLYCISGLGADERVFQYLKLKCEIIPLLWIKPLKNESIEAYSIRLASKMDTSGEYGVLGVSFGGLIAVEISKQLNPRFTILISSAETKHELRPLFLAFGKTGIGQLLPKSFFNLPTWFAPYLFGTKNKKLLNAILDDTDLSFTKWAVNELITWKNVERLDRVIKISGSNDKLIPPVNDNQTYLLDLGEHFMIVDRADEVSEIVNQELMKY